MKLLIVRTYTCASTKYI